MLKTTGSAFEGFIQDDFTTLPPVSDRILSTAVDASYNFPPSPGLTIDSLAAYGAENDFEGIAQKVRDATIETFAEDESASVQVCPRSFRLGLVLHLLMTGVEPRRPLSIIRHREF